VAWELKEERGEKHVNRVACRTLFRRLLQDEETSGRNVLGWTHHFFPLHFPSLSIRCAGASARRPPPCSLRVPAPPAREPFPHARAPNFFRALPNPIGTKAPSVHPYILPPQFFPIHSLRKKSFKSLCLPTTIGKTRHQSFIPVEELLPKPCARMNPTGPKKHQLRSSRTVVELAALAPTVDGAAGAYGAPDTSADGGGGARASGPVAGFPAVRTVQFNIILSELPVINIKMRANTRSC
jgi:hypothetical protein